MSGLRALWPLLVIAAALIGGLTATTLVRVSLPAALAVSVALGVIVALAAARRPGRSRNQPQTRSAAPGASGTRRAGPDRLAPAETVVELMPLSPTQDWWDGAQETPLAPNPAARRDPVPDLSDYLASSIIAQCPNCGAFRLESKKARNGWNFRCVSCRYAWNWRPNISWSPVRVAPERRRQLYANERQQLCMSVISAAGIRAWWCSCSTGPIR